MVIQWITFIFNHYASYSSVRQMRCIGRYVLTFAETVVKLFLMWMIFCCTDYLIIVYQDNR